MKCPYCQQENDRVVDTRTSDDGYVIRRRRVCSGCNKRFTTHERVESTAVKVIKRDGIRVPFDREKMRQGLERACWKRPISDAQISIIITQVEENIEAMNSAEIESKFIGERMMHYLRDLDQVAYIRFASVYLHFKDVHDFAQEIDKMIQNPDGHSFNAIRLPESPKLRFPREKRGKKRDEPKEL